MNIVDRIIKEKAKDEIAIKDGIQLSKGIEGVKRVKNPVINWHHTRSLASFGGTDWEQVEYEFADIERISDIDSYLLQSFRKKLGLALKEGYSFVSAETDNVQYVEKRIKQIAHASVTT